MKQKSVAQIREELRKEMIKMFDRKYQHLIDELNRYKKSFNESNERFNKYYKNLSELKEENEILKNIISQYEDWIHRLQEFMDIKDENERKTAFNEYIKECQAKSNLESLMSVYSNILNNIFSF